MRALLYMDAIGFSCCCWVVCVCVCVCVCEWEAFVVMCHLEELYVTYESCRTLT